jgi:hypothetical protein
MTSSCIQRQARLPTVVSWAGCRWVKPAQPPGKLHFQ